MMKHRGFGLVLGAAALIGFGQTANAGSIVLTITGGGKTLTISSPGSAFLAAGQNSANNYVGNLAAINKFFSGAGFGFSSLNVVSNNPGASTGATLTVNGSMDVTATGATPSVTITATQTGFTSPSAMGTLASAATANYTDATAGTQTSFSSVDSAATASRTETSTSTAANSHSDTDTTKATGSATGYSLTDNLVINLAGPAATLNPSTGAVTSAGAQDQFTVGATFASAVPEPASLVMMLTGMPLPLVVMGLLRRRRAVA